MRKPTMNFVRNGFKEQKEHSGSEYIVNNIVQKVDQIFTWLVSKLLLTTFLEIIMSTKSELEKYQLINLQLT